MTQLFVLIALVLTASAVTTAVEAALFSVPYSRVLAGVEGKRSGAVALKHLKDHMPRTIMAIVIVNNVSNVLGSIVIGSVAAKTFADSWIGVFSVVFTLLVIVFAEVLPKTYGERHADTLAFSSAPTLFACKRILSPFIWFVERLTSPFTHGARSVTTSEDEIKALSRFGSHTGAIDEVESKLIHKVFQLNDITAWDMMTPWRFVEALDGRDRVKDAMERVVNIKYSRVPVYDKHPNKVTGIVHMRALLQALVDGRGDAPVSTFAHDTQFVPDSAVGDDLISHFQKNEDHFSIVVDSLGNVVGVLSLEDVLEELVGELIHEGDVDAERIKRVSKTEILVDAETEVERVNIFFNTMIPGEGRMGELLLKAFGHIPKAGEAHTLGNVECIVERATPRRVEQIRVRKHEPAA